MAGQAAKHQHGMRSQLAQLLNAYFLALLSPAPLAPAAAASAWEAACSSKQVGHQGTVNRDFCLICNCHGADVARHKTRTYILLRRLRQLQHKHRGVSTRRKVDLENQCAAYISDGKDREADNQCKQHNSRETHRQNAVVDEIFSGTIGCFSVLIIVSVR